MTARARTRLDQDTWEIMDAMTSRALSLPSGEPMPTLGQGTWYLGERPATRASELAALRLGLDLGMSLIDTAEMYGDGAGTIAACETSLRRLGTNFDVDDLAELRSVPGGEAVAADQVLYNLSRRGIEYDLLADGLPIMAYTPIEQGRILRDRVLRRVAERHEATPARIALAWVLRHEGVAAIPRSGARRPAHRRGSRGVG